MFFKQNKPANVVLESVPPNAETPHSGFRFLSFSSYSGLPEQADSHTTSILSYTKILILDREVPFVSKHSLRSPQAQTNLHLLHNLQDAGNLEKKE